MPLYILTEETMAINIRESPRIHGIRRPDSEEELKLTQYADDTTMLLSTKLPLMKLLPHLICVNVLLVQK